MAVEPEVVVSEEALCGICCRSLAGKTLYRTMREGEPEEIEEITLEGTGDKTLQDLYPDGPAYPLCSLCASKGMFAVKSIEERSFGVRTFTVGAEATTQLTPFLSGSIRIRGHLFKDNYNGTFLRGSCNTRFIDAEDIWRLVEEEKATLVALDKVLGEKFASRPTAPSNIAWTRAGKKVYLKPGDGLEADEFEAFEIRLSTFRGSPGMRAAIAALTGAKVTLTLVQAVMVHDNHRTGRSVWCPLSIEPWHDN